MALVREEPLVTQISFAEAIEALVDGLPALSGVHLEAGLYLWHAASAN